MRIWSRIVLQMTLLISDILYILVNAMQRSEWGKSSDKGLGSFVHSHGCFLSNSVFEYRIMHTKKRAVASIEDKTWTSVFKVVWAKNNYLKIGENDELETFNKKMKPSASMPRRDNKLVGIKLHWRLKFWPKSSSLGKPAGDYHYYLKCGTLHGKLPSLLTRQNFANSDNYFPKENHKNLAHLVWQRSKNFCAF